MPAICRLNSALKFVTDSIKHFRNPAETKNELSRNVLKYNNHLNECQYPYQNVYVKGIHYENLASHALRCDYIVSITKKNLR